MSNSTQTNAELMKYEGKPSWGAAFPQAMQHVLAMLIGNITPPMLIAATCGLSAEDKILLTQAAMIIGGITTLLQLFPVFGFGMKLPNVMGVAFAYMPILTIIGEQYGIAAIFGSQLVAGFASIFIGMFISKIRRFFPPIVSGTVVMSIGLSLYKTAISYIGGGTAAQNAGTFGSGRFWLLAILTLVVTLACNFFGKGLLKASGMLIGIAVGYAAALFMGDVVSFADLNSAAWFSLPRPFHFGLEFHFDAIIMMILMYMVQAVQTIGDVSSTTIGGFGRECTDQELGGAIKGQGICGMFSGLMATIPQPVLGGATVTVFAAITMSGIQLLNEQPMNYRNRMIVGIALALGLGIDAAPDILQFVPQLMRNIFGSSLVVSFLVVFILNIIIPKDDSPAD